MFKLADLSVVCENTTTNVVLKTRRLTTFKHCSFPSSSSFCKKYQIKMVKKTHWLIYVCIASIYLCVLFLLASFQIRCFKHLINKPYLLVIQPLSNDIVVEEILN